MMEKNTSYISNIIKVYSFLHILHLPKHDQRHSFSSESFVKNLPPPSPQLLAPADHGHWSWSGLPKGCLFFSEKNQSNPDHNKPILAFNWSLENIQRADISRVTVSPDISVLFFEAGRKVQQRCLGQHLDHVIIIEGFGSAL